MKQPEKRSRRHTDTRQPSGLVNGACVLVTVGVSDVAAAQSLCSLCPLAGPCRSGELQRLQGGEQKSRAACMRGWCGAGGIESFPRAAAVVGPTQATRAIAARRAFWPLSPLACPALPACLSPRPHGAPVLGSAANLTRSCCLARGRTLASKPIAGTHPSDTSMTCHDFRCLSCPHSL